MAADPALRGRRYEHTASKSGLSESGSKLPHSRTAS
jgi:hypothetical protein